LEKYLSQLHHFLLDQKLQENFLLLHLFHRHHQHLYHFQSQGQDYHHHHFLDMLFRNLQVENKNLRHRRLLILQEHRVDNKFQDSWHYHHRRLLLRFEN